MNWARREIIELMYEYHVVADEKIEELADDIIQIFEQLKEKNNE